MKEWTGNKNSVHAMLGTRTRWEPDNRAPGDFYSTDTEAVRAFLKQMQYTWGPDKNIRYWEPACGNGNICRALETDGYGHNVLSTDLFDRGYGVSGVDFLNSELPDNVNVIITNPPYSLASEFILHAMDILPADGMYASLLNINYLSGKSRFRDIYSKGYLKYIYIYAGRIKCYKNGIENDISSPVNYGWYIFTPVRTDAAPVIKWI